MPVFVYQTFLQVYSRGISITPFNRQNIILQNYFFPQRNHFEEMKIIKFFKNYLLNIQHTRYCDSWLGEKQRCIRYCPCLSSECFLTIKKYYFLHCCWKFISLFWRNGTGLKRPGIRVLPQCSYSQSNFGTVTLSQPDSHIFNRIT